MEKIKKSNLIVYIFFIAITFCKGIGFSNSNNIYICIYALGVALLILKIIKDKISKKEFFNIFSILCIGVLDFFIGGETTILFTAIALCSLKNISIDNIIKIMFWTRVVSFVILFVFSSLGIIDNNTLIFYRESEGGFITRNSFGFSHPNIAHSALTLIVILYGYIFYNKINTFNMILLELLNILLYQFTFSRTGFFITTIYVLFLFMVKKFKFVRNALPKILNITLIMCLIFTFFMAFGYGKIGFINDLDSLLTGRIRYMNILVKSYNIPIIGKIDYNNILFDNGYISLLYTGGILATSWFLFQQIKTNNIIKNRKTEEMIITIILMIYSLFESFYANILMNPALLFFAYYIFGNTEKGNGKENE